MARFALMTGSLSENDEYYAFSVGAREFIIDRDFSYAIYGGVPAVFKSDGRIESRPSVEVAMDPGRRERPNPNPTLTV